MIQPPDIRRATPSGAARLSGTIAGDPTARDSAKGDTAVNLYRGRFAPSPTGPLHVGSLVAAFGSWLMARHAKGEWLVRIEDLDPPRAVLGAAEAQLQTLQAFGLVSDGPILRQSDRYALYTAAIEQLRRTGHAFDCHCSRSDLAVERGVHRICRTINPRASSAIRMRVIDGTEVTFDDSIHGRIAQRVDLEAGDVVLRRADGYWAYQLAVVVDDAAQGITDIVRGADLLDSTPRQILLQRALGLPTPRYAHLPLIVDSGGNKWSKSLAALPIDPRDPLPALRLAWRALGQIDTVLSGSGNLAASLARACAEFDPCRIGRQKIDFAALHNISSIDGA